MSYGDGGIPIFLGSGIGEGDSRKSMVNSYFDSGATCNLEEII